MTLNFIFFGELIALITAISWTCCLFPFTEAARRIGPNPMNHFRLLVALFLLSLMVLFITSGFSGLFTPQLTNAWLWLALSGFVGLALGDYFGFSSFAILGPRVASIFITVAPTGALLFGYILLGETINMVGFSGILITIGGIIWLRLNEGPKVQNIDTTHGSIAKGVLFGILAATCQGAGLAIAKKGLISEMGDASISPIQATWIRMLAATFILFFISLASRRLRNVMKPVIQNNRGGSYYAIAGAIFGPVLGVCLSVYTITLIEVSVAQTIFSLIPVLVLPVNYFYYKERITGKALIGAAIAIGGVMILIWRDTLQQLTGLY